MSVRDLSWGETSFPAKLQLFLESRKRARGKIRSSGKRGEARGCAALSSVYYDIAGTALFQLKAAFRSKWLAPVKITAWCVTWLPLGAWCYIRMCPLSNQVVEIMGYDGMSADQCCDRQSILRCCGEYEEAKRCIYAALAKGPGKAHTRGLLHVGLAEVYWYEGNKQRVREEAYMAVAEAERSEKQEPRQAVRIYRHCADLFSRIMDDDRSPAADLRRKAKALALAIGAHDQLLKLS